MKWMQSWRLCPNQKEGANHLPTNPECQMASQGVLRDNGPRSLCGLFLFLVVFFVVCSVLAEQKVGATLLTVG